ncbi:MAG: helix-turn-helix domain-containing protein [Acidimicrobiia bacterium]|nr:helix-turn-helix domain-containing protein [Acidimicrobiia bacterium]
MEKLAAGIGLREADPTSTGRTLSAGVGVMGVEQGLAGFAKIGGMATTATEAGRGAARRPLGGGVTAAVLVLTARAARRVSAAALAQAAGCELSMVADIEEGRLDPTLDTVERLVNAIGLEVRAGAHTKPNPAYEGVTASEVERVRAAFEEVQGFKEAYGIRPVGPPPGVQPEWDGLGSAPPRPFGAGPTRRDGGGWGAILLRGERALTNTALNHAASTAGISDECVGRIEDGTFRPPVSMVESLLAAMGRCLQVRLEPYDDHDDVLHLRALADPERYQRRLANGERAFATAVALD